MSRRNKPGQGRKPEGGRMIQVIVRPETVEALDKLKGDGEAKAGRGKIIDGMVLAHPMAAAVPAIEPPTEAPDCQALYLAGRLASGIPQRGPSFVVIAESFALLTGKRVKQIDGKVAIWI